MTDHDVIDAFVAFLAANGSPWLVVTDHPEEHKDGEIDAVAGDLAIEHTSIDTLKNQRRDSDWFTRLIENIEQEVPTPKYLLWLFIREADVRRPKSWELLREALRSWLRSDAADALKDGDHAIALKGFPDALRVRKWSNVPPGIFFMRVAREDESLRDRLRERCDQKIKKLVPWRAAGKTTVLLLETDDFALMNQHKLADAVYAAYPQKPAGIDQVWHADTSIQPIVNLVQYPDAWDGTIGRPAMWDSKSKIVRP